MKPMRNLVLIDQEDLVSEEHHSGLVLLKGNNDLYQFGDDNQRVWDMITKKKLNRGIVKLTGDGCTFCEEEMPIVYKKNTEQYNIKYNERMCVFVKEDDVLCYRKENIFIPHPDKIIIKITLESREALFAKKIKCDDGREIELFTSQIPDDTDERHSQFFVSTGEVTHVGENVKNIIPGDIAILNYLLDNDENIIVGYDGVDKLIATSPVTVYCEKDEWAYANRRVETDREKPSFGKKVSPKNVMVSAKGDYEYMSDVIGVIRGDELIPCDPYVFLQHESNSIARVSDSGILYTEDQKYFSRKVLGISDYSSRKYKVGKGDDVLVDDFDIFEATIKDRKVSFVNDRDVVLNLTLRKFW